MGATLVQQVINPPKRTPFIGVLDRVLRHGRHIGAIAPARLTKTELFEQAIAATGLDDFGDPWFERPMDVLLEAVRGEARLNDAGTFAAEKQFHQIGRAHV